MLPEPLSNALLVFVCAAVSLYGSAFILLSEDSVTNLQMLLAGGPIIYTHFFLGVPIYVLVVAALAVIGVLVLLALGGLLYSYRILFRLSLLATGVATLGIVFGVFTDLPLFVGEIAAYGFLLYLNILLWSCAIDEREPQPNNDAGDESQPIPQPQLNRLWPPEAGTGEGQFSSERAD